MLAGHDVLIIGVGMLLLYADIGQYYIIHGRTMKGYLSDWGTYLKRLVS